MTDHYTTASNIRMNILDTKRVILNKQNKPNEVIKINNDFLKKNNVYEFIQDYGYAPHNTLHDYNMCVCKDILLCYMDIYTLFAEKNLRTKITEYFYDVLLKILQISSNNPINKSRLVYQFEYYQTNNEKMYKVMYDILYLNNDEVSEHIDMPRVYKNNFVDFLLYVCSEGHLTSAKLSNNGTFKNITYDCFDKGNFKFIEILMTYIDIKTLILDGPVRAPSGNRGTKLVKIEYDSYLMILCCQFNNLEFFKKLYKKYKYTKVQIFCKDNNAFRSICKQGNLEMMEYFHHHFIFEKSCYNARSRYGLNISCKNNHVQIFNFLRKHFTVKYEHIDNSTLNALIANESVEILNHVFKLLSEHSDYITLFVTICKHNKLKLLIKFNEFIKKFSNYVTNMYKIYTLSIMEITNCDSKPSVEMFKYLHELFYNNIKSNNPDRSMIFIRIYHNDHDELIKYLKTKVKVHKKMYTTVPYWNKYYDDEFRYRQKYMYNTIVENCCKNGDLEKLKEIHKEHNLELSDIEMRNYRCLRLAGMYEHIDIIDFIHKDILNERLIHE